MLGVRVLKLLKNNGQRSSMSLYHVLYSIKIFALCWFLRCRHVAIYLGILLALFRLFPFLFWSKCVYLQGHGGSGGSLAFLLKKSHLTLLKCRWIKRVIVIYQQFLLSQLSQATTCQNSKLVPLSLVLLKIMGTKTHSNQIS